jgi:hypothetical protein
MVVYAALLPPRMTEQHRAAKSVAGSGDLSTLGRAASHPALLHGRRLAKNVQLVLKHN